MHFASLWRVALNLNGLDKGLLFKEQFICLSATSDKANRVGRVKRELAESFAGKVENIDFGLEFSDVGYKDLLARDGPVLDGCITLRHYIHEPRFLISPWTYFCNTKVRSVSIGNCQNPPVLKQQRPEFVLSSRDDQLRVGGAVHWPQQEVRLDPLAEMKY